MRIHFIAIGGSIMHNLAIALHNKGHQVSGSDDAVFDPAKSRLESHGLLPNKMGWFPEKINQNIDWVILGMHAKGDNPELQKALKIKLEIHSFPELVFSLSSEKLRVAIAGSHGKTTITSMVMHVLAHAGQDFNYLVGAKVKGFQDSVRLNESAKSIVLEADEYLSSPLDPRPKFLWYKPQVALISGIAWDHMNVFKTFEDYKKQFSLFIQSIPEGGSLIYFKGDKVLARLVGDHGHVKKIPYGYPGFNVQDGVFELAYNDQPVRVKMNGSHNLLNMEGARKVCHQLGVSDDVFYSAIQDFEGAGKRLETLYSDGDCMVFKDFAHAPSKVKATISGIKEQYKGKRVIACLELHTYSSLNKNFLPQYAHTADDADGFSVYINEGAVKLKGLEMISAPEVKDAFQRSQMKVFFNLEGIKEYFSRLNLKGTIVLLMSSGDFNGWDLKVWDK